MVADVASPRDTLSFDLNGNPGTLELEQEADDSPRPRSVGIFEDIPGLADEDHDTEEDSDGDDPDRFHAIKSSIFHLFGGESKTLPRAPGVARESMFLPNELDEDAPKEPKERPFTGGGISYKHNLWRVPGHHDDGTWTDELKSAMTKQKEVQDKKKIGGEFVVGTARAPPPDQFRPDASLMSLSTMSRSSTRSARSRPAHNPYDSICDGPSGRWVLKDGRPCCVPPAAFGAPAPTKVQRTRDSLKNQKKIEGGRRLTPHNHPIGLEAPAGTNMGRRKTFFSLADFGMIRSSGHSNSSGSCSSSGSVSSSSCSSSSSRSGSSSSSSASSKSDMTTLAKSCRTGAYDHPRGSVKHNRQGSKREHHEYHEKHPHHRKSLLDKRATQRRRSHKTGGDMDEIEEIQDILKPLDHMPALGEELSHVLPRFSWTRGLNSMAPGHASNTAVEDFAHHDLPFLSSRGSHKLDMMVSQNLRIKRRGGQRNNAHRGTHRATHIPGKIMFNIGGSTHRGTYFAEHAGQLTGSTHTSGFSSRRGTTSQTVSAVASRRGTGAPIGKQGLTHYMHGHVNNPRQSVKVASDGRAGKMVDRDLRSELKKLQQSLLSSAQQAFGNDVWEECGIEAEHLKRQQLAQLIHGGLSLNREAKKEDLDVEEEENEEETEEPSEAVRRQSVRKNTKAGQRVTVALKINFKDDTESSRAPSKGNPVAKQGKKKATIKEK